jgi:hypothetical protein
MNLFGADGVTLSCARDDAQVGGMTEDNKARENRGPIWPLVLIGVGGVVTLAWVGYLGSLAFRLLTLLASAASQLVERL